MDTKGLQIGNNVRYDGKIIVVESVFPKGINAHTDSQTGKVSYIHVEDIEPVELTTDLLRRSGMIQAGTRWTFKDRRGVYVDRRSINYYLSIGNLGSSVCQLYTLHQLQNILLSAFGIALQLRFT